MTLTEVTNQIYDLTIAGYINGEKFTKKEFKDAMHHWFLTKSQFIIEVSLPDGRWLCKIAYIGNGEWDYFLPETRKQEERLYAELGIKNC
jgi:hypothetical protein